MKKSPKSKSKKSPLRGKYPSKSTTFTLKKNIERDYWEYTSKFFIPKSEKDIKKIEDAVYKKYKQDFQQIKKVDFDLRPYIHGMKNGKKIDMGYIIETRPSGLKLHGLTKYGNVGMHGDYQLPGIYPIQLRFIVFNRRDDDD